MAGPDRCDGCQEAPADFGLSNLQNGDTQFLCGGCFAGFGLAFAKEVLPADVIREHLGPIFVGPAKDDSKPKRAQSAEPQPDPEPEPTEPNEPAPEGLAEPETATSDG